MKYFGYKEEYVILSQIQKRKTYDFKFSIINNLYNIITKAFFIILFISLIITIFLLDIISQETYITFQNGNITTYLTKEMVDKFNNYTNICANDILIDKKKYPLVKNPKISAIIPIYNGGKYLHYSLRSIQNQKMKDIEIILIDDCSTDNSLTIIEMYMKEDERIRLIKNIENRKILYSKSFSALNSKGKYIILLDQDDIFIRDDVFDMLYNEAEKESLDLVHIRDICKHNLLFKNLTRVNFPGRHLIFQKRTHYKKQPDLKDKIYIEGNYLLWGLLIRSEIYKKAIYHLWPLIINYKITFHEDYSITFMLIILSKKYKYLNNFALIHLYHSNSTSKDFLNNDIYYLSVLFCANINNNPKDIQIFINYYYLFKENFNKSKKLFPNFYNFIMNKVLNNDYLSLQQRQYFQNISNSKESNFELIENFEYEKIFNYQIAISSKNNSSNIYEPKISIIIFCNEYKYLEKTINSIQKQNFIYYEIILIYDNSEQNDIDLIQKFEKKYSNIHLINNKKERGLINSISFGVLSSKGKYILILEPSNTLVKQNTLNELYNIINNGNIDILEFNLLINTQKIINKNSLNLYKCHHFKSDLNLEIFKYNKNYINIDQQKELLINKLIKSDLFKNIIKKYKLNEIQREVYNYYDNIFLFALKNSNNNFNRSNIFGVIKNIYNFNSLKINNIFKDKTKKIKDSIFYINFILDNSYNSFKEKKYVLNEYFNVMSIIYNKFNNISSESYILYEKFMKCQYITQSDKKYLQFYYNSLIN